MMSKRTPFTLVAKVLAPAMCAVALLAGCNRDSEGRELQYMPDMYENPAIKAQKASAFFRNGSGMLMPPAGSVPRGFRPYPFAIPDRLGARVLENPLPRTAEVFATGQKYFNVHCRVCHGVVGAGDGLATQVHREAGMPIPPSLYSDKIRGEWNDGELFHVITMGQGQMPPYGARIREEHRWAIVHYVRALGVAANPSEEDLRAVERLAVDPQTDDDPYRQMGPLNQLYLQSLKVQKP